MVELSFRSLTIYFFLTLGLVLVIFDVFNRNLAFWHFGVLGDFKSQKLNAQGTIKGKFYHFIG